MEQRRSKTNDGTVFHKNECIGPIYQEPRVAGAVKEVDYVIIRFKFFVKFIMYVVFQRSFKDQYLK